MDDVIFTINYMINPIHTIFSGIVLHGRVKKMDKKITMIIKGSKGDNMSTYLASQPPSINTNING